MQAFIASGGPYRYSLPIRGWQCASRQWQAMQMSHCEVHSAFSSGERQLSFAIHPIRRPPRAELEFPLVTTPWKPSKSVAYVIAVLTVWPPVYFCLFLAFIAFSFSSIANHPGGGTPRIDLFAYVIPIHLLTMLLMFALTAVYVVHAFRSDEVAQDRRVLWVIILFFGNMFAFPVYWWFYMRPSRPVAAAAPSAVSTPLA